MLYIICFVEGEPAKFLCKTLYRSCHYEKDFYHLTTALDEKLIIPTSKEKNSKHTVILLADSKVKRHNASRPGKSQDLSPMTDW